MTKYIFVTGGVLSGVGKGITAASLGNILKSRGWRVNLQKCDPYLNTDAGTLNPAEHGEVFVTADGAETDLDLGHYERFLDEELTRASSLMSGRIYAKVIMDEREGKYLGKTVQIIPHVTTEIINQIIAAGEGFDIHIVEIGGTVGDYESLGFLEAVRQFKRKVGTANVVYVHLVYLPYLEVSDELKTKPAQNTVRDLREAGIQADVIVARAEREVSPAVLAKLSLFCDVEVEGIVALPTVKSVYEVPLILERAGLGGYISGKLGLPDRAAKLRAQEKVVQLAHETSYRPLQVAVVAKYMDNRDTYMSVFEAIKAAGWAAKVRPEVTWIDAEQIEVDGASKHLAGFDGIVVPGGFGSRGVEGKIAAASYAMEHSMPYLGLCLGMQTAVIALARKVLRTPLANTTEVDPETPEPVIDFMADQHVEISKGGTMRLGNYTCVLDPASIAARAYQAARVEERHRHRYEFNNRYRERLVAAGLRLAGLSPDGRLVELIELDAHPFFVASQFHPEFKSRPSRPHPLFAAFVAACGKRQLARSGTAVKTAKRN